MRGNPMIARTRQRIVRQLIVVIALSAATVAIFCGTAQAQSLSAASATASAEYAQIANTNDQVTGTQLTVDYATHVVVVPGDSLWSITEERLDPSTTPEQLMN